MTEQVEKARRFLALHRGQQPLLLPNPWDRGSAVLLASLGFQALATTSSGFAATLGRADGRVTGDEAVAHSASIVQATALPVTADLENGFADEPDGVAETVRLAVKAGLPSARARTSRLPATPLRRRAGRARAGAPRRPPWAVHRASPRAETCTPPDWPTPRPPSCLS